MDVPFDLQFWQPTRPLKPDDKRPDVTDMRALIQRLADQTNEIHRAPYDPESWLRRSETLRRLRYPELALGDAHKATLLCRQHLRQLWDDTQGHWRLGKGMGFWMLAEEPDENGVRQRLQAVEEKAKRAGERNLCSTADGKGKFYPRPYPWLAKEKTKRSDALVAQMNNEMMAHAAGAAEPGPLIEIRRHAFAHTRADTADVLGVFATHDIVKDSTVLIDKSRVWGCNGPGKAGDLQNLHYGAGCGDPIHPNLPEELCSFDLRWIRDETGKDASSALVICRLLLAAVQDGFRDPLDHPLVARLTPTWRYDVEAEPQSFYAHNDVDVPMRALQQFGVDVFANHAFDTWVLFTIFARAENNSCGDLISESLMPLFSLFNHSCEPNVNWIRVRSDGGGGAKDGEDEGEEENNWSGQRREEHADHATIVVRAARDIKAGEQLFVEYDSFVHDQGVQERRKRLKKWLAGDCMCERCVREEREGAGQQDALRQSSGSQGSGSGSGSGSGATASWDDREEEVELPEDELASE